MDTQRDIERASSWFILAGMIGAIFGAATGSLPIFLAAGAFALAASSMPLAYAVWEDRKCEAAGQERPAPYPAATADPEVGESQFRDRVRAEREEQKVSAGRSRGYCNRGNP
jgi:hypothetical protein